MYDLSQDVDSIENALHLMFNALMDLPAEVRPPDEKPRTGIQCCIKQVHTRNIIMPKAYNPSPVALHLASEKIVRAYERGYHSSRVNADPEKFEFAGGLIVKVGKDEIHCGISGMTQDEDEAISFVILSRLLRQSPGNLIRMIYPCEEDVPACILDKFGYIFSTLLPFTYH